MLKRATFALVLVALVAVVTAGTIRETDSNIFSYNIRVNATLLQSVLPPQLKPDMYDGSAWLTYNTFRIERIEVPTPIFGGWSTMMAIPTWVTKTYIPVYHTSAADRGYLLLTMDFEPSFTGIIQQLGCSGTQKGVQCNKAENFVVDTPTSPPSFLSTKMEGNNMFYNFTGSYVATNSSYLTPPADFVAWLVNRTNKYELGDGQHPTFSSQSGRDDPLNYQGAVSIVTDVEGAGFSTNILTTRVPQLAPVEVPENLMSACHRNQGRGFCFTAPYLLFVDPDSKPVQ
eukprot:PhM_4_TR11829/c0_g1_i1/m.7948